MSLLTTRRTLLSLPLLIAPRSANAAKPPRILLRSSWQSVNIGDIGHTPGALDILKAHLPEAEITLWPGQLGHGSRDLLTRNYPNLKIVEGAPDSPAIQAAWQQADLYLSGSGSGFPAANHAVAFRKATNKPVGVFGVSTDPISGFGDGRIPEGGTLKELHAKARSLPQNHLPDDLRFIIDNAAFFFCRDTISRDYLKAQKVKTPILEFGPDAQLAMTLRDDAKAEAFCQRQNLETGKFLCVIPRLRYTPYYKIRNTPRVPTDDVKDAINDRSVNEENAKLRDMISRYVRNTGNKVLACAEMTYEVELSKEVLVDPLPAEIKKNVIWRDSYWLPDEAASVYRKAQAVVSVECHSPLMAYHNGTPAIYVRQPTDTCKGQMYHDFGASDWIFEIDSATGSQLWKTVEAIHKNPNKAKAKVQAIMRTVQTRQKRMAQAVQQACK